MFRVILRTFQLSWEISKHSWKFPDTLESCQELWKVPWQFKKVPGTQGNFGIFWKVYGNPEKFSDTLKSLRTLWKASKQSQNFWHTSETFRQFENFPYTMESFQTLWRHGRIYWQQYQTLCKLYGNPGKCPDTLGSLGVFWKVSGHSKSFQTL